MSGKLCEPINTLEDLLAQKSEIQQAWAINRKSVQFQLNFNSSIDLDIVCYFQRYVTVETDRKHG